MRERTYGINIRVTRTEKNKLIANAEKCRLSVSAYLRKLGLGQALQPLPTKEFETLYRELYDLQNRIDRLDKSMIKVVLEDVQTKLLNLYHGFERYPGPPKSRETFWGEEHSRSDKPLPACGESDERRAM